MISSVIHGFSKLSRSEKLTWLEEQAGISPETLKLLNNHLHHDPELQALYTDISENNISNFFLPLGLAPNFLINGTLMTVPMVIEESSVVAAASNAAKFWAMHGGFHATVADTLKNGQVHFTWTGSEKHLQQIFSVHKEAMRKSVTSITERMEQRGGGIVDLEIRSSGTQLPGFYQLFVTFHTSDAMGANFINSVLEAMAGKLVSIMQEEAPDSDLKVIMSILSNYTPGCRVTCYVEGNDSIFESMDSSMSGEEFSKKFVQAVQVAIHDPYRAVTHNKGIFNGMDAVIMATGNDFRAVEASGHAYAARKGKYSSLSRAEHSEGTFRFTLEVPLSVGTVGGLTGIHPLSKASLEILGGPTAEQLMQVIAAAGLANNFSAVRSLITSGIQRGHMRMHLGNILKQLKASPEQTRKANTYFMDRAVSFAAVTAFIEANPDQSTKL